MEAATGCIRNQLTNMGKPVNDSNHQERQSMTQPAAQLIAFGSSSRGMPTGIPEVPEPLPKLSCGGHLLPLSPVQDTSKLFPRSQGRDLDLQRGE